MMLRGIFCFVLSLFLLNASAQTAEVRTYGGFQADEGREILETPTGYLIVGTTASPENGNNDIYVVHILEDLTVDWSTTLGGAGADQGRSAVMTNEGDFLILGQTSLGENGGYDIVVYRIDASGNQLWEKQFGTDDWDFATRIEKGGNNYYIAGTTYGEAPGNSRMLLLRIAANGDIIDENTYDILPEAEANDLVWYEDHLYLIGTRTFEGETPQGILRKLTPSGAVVWTDVRDSVAFQGLSLDISEQGLAACYAMADEASDGNEYWNIMMIKQDLDGIEEWFEFSDVSEPGNQLPTAVTWSDAVMLQAAYTDIFGNGGDGCYINRIWFNGAWLSSTVFGLEGDEQPYDIMEDSQERILILGVTDSYGSGDEDVYLIRLPDEEIVFNYDIDYVELTEDETLVGLEEYSSTFGIPYPNPTVGQLKIPGSYDQWVLYNLLGQEVMRGKQKETDLSNLERGVYTLKRSVNDRQIVDHIILR